MIIVGLAVLVEVIVLVLFTVPSAQAVTFDAVHLTPSQRDKLTQYSTAVGALFVVIVVLQLFGLLLILLRCSSLDDHYDSDTEDSDLLASYKAGVGNSKPARMSNVSPGRGYSALGGLLEDNPAPPASAPASRLTYSSLYDKYGRR